MPKPANTKTLFLSAFHAEFAAAAGAELPAVAAPPEASELLPTTAAVALLNPVVALGDVIPAENAVVVSIVLNAPIVIFPSTALTAPVSIDAAETREAKTDDALTVVCRVPALAPVVAVAMTVWGSRRMLLGAKMGWLEVEVVVARVWGRRVRRVKGMR
ncbi:MAG: hypothetical protein LQ352_004588 [Teloschistes flavicans]|nr:MAG: hypothetical protein LQ352_004588 [Teloschistes flavicans]